MESWEGASGGHTEALLWHKESFLEDNWRVLLSGLCLRGSHSSSSKAEKENSLQAGRRWGRGQLQAQRDSHQLASITRALSFE